MTSASSALVIQPLAASIPVHRHERRRDGVMQSASAVMHQLAWELIPSLQGVHADAPHRQEPST